MNCEVCNSVIKTMCFRGTGVCSELCRKVRENGNGPRGKGAREAQSNVE